MFVFGRFFPSILSSFVVRFEPSLPQHSTMTLETGLIASVRGWWWFLIKGIFFVITGIVILSGPVEAYVGSGILVCIPVLGIGISQLLFAITNREILPGWGWTLASGIIDLAAGFYVALFPIITLATLPFFAGFWLLFRSSYFIGISLDLQSYRRSGWGWLFAGGLVLMTLSCLTLYFPSDAATGFILWAGTAFLAGGVMSVVIAIKFRDFDK